MVAASVWSLIIPAVEHSASLGIMSFFPAVVGILIGVLFMILVDKALSGLDTLLGDGAIVPLAVTLHNLPEGMAVGVAFAAAVISPDKAAIASAMALSVGIALQDIPEGAIISMPLPLRGMGRWRAFLVGAMSGAIEPIGAVLALIASGFFIALLPYVLCFAAGVMLFVTAEELVPEMLDGKNPHLGTAFFATGFCLMMSLDIALG
jgi:ZIP family zinc transporter